jgi:hypothetical protein
VGRKNSGEFFPLLLDLLSLFHLSFKLSSALSLPYTLSLPHAKRTAKNTPLTPCVLSQHTAYQEQKTQERKN